MKVVFSLSDYFSLDEGVELEGFDIIQVTCPECGQQDAIDLAIHGESKRCLCGNTLYVNEELDTPPIDSTGDDSTRYQHRILRVGR